VVDVGAAELTGGGRRRCARVGEGRHVGEERCIEEGRRVGEEPLVGEGRVRDGPGEERRGSDLGEKRVSADLEGDWAYIEPSTFCHGSCSQP
jgi:hypothetical protein